MAGRSGGAKGHRNPDHPGMDAVDGAGTDGKALLKAIEKPLRDGGACR